MENKKPNIIIVGSGLHKACQVDLTGVGIKEVVDHVIGFAYPPGPFAAEPYTLHFNGKMVVVSADNISHPHQELPAVLMVDDVSGMLPKTPIEFPIVKLHSDHDYIGPVKDGRQLRRERRKGERRNK